MVTHDKSVVLIHMETSVRTLCCDLIIEGGREGVFPDGRLLQRPVVFQLPPLGKVRGGHIFPGVKGKHLVLLPGRQHGVI